MKRPLRLFMSQTMYDIEFRHVTPASIERMMKALPPTNDPAQREKHEQISDLIERDMALLVHSEEGPSPFAKSRRSFNGITFAKVRQVIDNGDKKQAWRQHHDDVFGTLEGEGHAACSTNEVFMRKKGRRVALRRAVKDWSVADRERFWNAYNLVFGDEGSEGRRSQR